MREVKHTPLPWKAEAGEGRGARIVGADEKWSALPCGDTDETVIANKAFIVRACNSHYELLDALRRIAAHTDADDEESYRCDDREGCLDTVHAIAIAAISKAEGRP